MIYWKGANVEYTSDDIEVEILVNDDMGNSISPCLGSHGTVLTSFSDPKSAGCMDVTVGNEDWR